MKPTRGLASRLPRQMFAAAKADFEPDVVHFGRKDLRQMSRGRSRHVGPSEGSRFASASP